MSICINHCNFKFYLGLKFKYNWYYLVEINKDGKPFSQKIIVV
jgi:hypothetical protein